MSILVLLADDDSLEQALSTALDISPSTGQPATQTIAVVHQLFAEPTDEEQSTCISYVVAVEVEIYVFASDPAQLGSMANAGYAQLLRTLLPATTLGGLVEGVIEQSFRLDVDQTGFSSPTAVGTLALQMTLDRPRNVPLDRAPLRAALAALLATNEPQEEPSLREILCGAVTELVTTTLGREAIRNPIRAIDLEAEGGDRSVVREGEHEADREQDTEATTYRFKFALEIYSGEADPVVRDASLDAQERALRAALLPLTELAGVPIWFAEDTSDEEDDERSDNTAPTEVRTMRPVITFQTAPDNPAALPAAA